MSKSSQYICDLCKHNFSQKIDLMRHKNKKTSCVSLSQIVDISQEINKKNDDKSILINVFKSCLNILRDNETLMGEKALRNLSYLIILKLIEPHFGKEIDIDGYNYDLSHIEDDIVEEHKKRLLEVVRFSKLLEEKEENLPSIMEPLWRDILSDHPATRNIFLKGNNFEIKKKETFKKIIDKLGKLDLEHTDYDVLGNAYEEVIQDIMTGKVLGQFFTPPLIKKMMIKLIKPQIFEDGTIETFGDPTMGTGGFLITYLKYILDQAKAKNITPNWNFIKNEGIYGKEIDVDTYQLAVSNMLISSGHMFDKLEKGDSIRDPITRKFDNVLANPPFGIKGLKYDDINNETKEEYIPIRSDNAVSLFLQAIISMLKKNGKCAIVLPDGKDLFSKTARFRDIREYLMKTCNLKEIIYLPSGIFTYTSIKTCVLFFIKKKEGKDIITKKSKKISFRKKHYTKQVKFYDYNPYEDIKNLLVKVPIEEIAENSYSLNYSEYMSKESEKEELNNDIELKTLGEICEFLSKSKRPASYGKDDGKYPFFKSSLKINSYVEENDYDKESLIIGDGGEPNINYGVKFSVSDHCFILQNKDNENVNLKYVYYFIYNNLNIMKTLYKGIGIKNISKSSLQDLQILIPSLEKQNKIVNYLDLIESSNNLSKKKIESLKELNKFYVDGQIEIFSTEKINLGEICEINIGGTPSRKKLEYYENSNYLWASVRELNGGYIFNTKEKINDLGVKNSSVKLFKKDTVLFSFKLSIGKTAIVGTPLYTNEAIAGLFSLDESILNNKYLYHYLTITDFSNLGSGIIGNGSLNKSSLQELKIPVLSLDIQNEIVIYCDDNNSLIKNLEEEIEKNKKQANLYLKNILQIQPLLNSEPQIETETDSQESNSQEAESEASSEAASSSKCEADD